MPTFKHVWEFQENDGSQFSEVYYRDGTSITGESLIGQALIDARLALLVSSVTFVRDRVSDTTNSRNTLINLINLQGTIGTTFNALPAGAALILQMSGQGGGSRKIWLRGGTAADYAEDPNTKRPTITPGTKAKITAFINQLSTAFFGIRRLTPNSPTSNPYITILKIDGTAANGTTTLTLQTGPGYATPARVIIGRANPKELPALNGHFQAITITTTPGPPPVYTMIIPYSTPNNLSFNGNGARVKQELYDTTKIFDTGRSGFAYLGTRITKAPLERSRGARRAKRLRQLV